MINLNSLNKVFIYTYGGVGSMSLHETIKTVQKYSTKQKLRVKNKPHKGRVSYRVYKDIFTSENVVHTHINNFLAQEIRQGPRPRPLCNHKNEKTLVISVARNLFDRNTSHFFEQFKKTPLEAVNAAWYYNTSWHNNLPLQGSWRQFENDAKECCIPLSVLEDDKALAEEHFSIFNKIQSKKLENWFDNLNSVLNMNVFDKPFDFEKKYSIHTAGNVTILTLRFEDIQYWQSIFDKIFTPSPILKEKNKSSEKWYSDIYKQFKKDYKYSKENINIMSNINWMKFYYKKDELNSIIKKYK